MTAHPVHEDTKLFVRHLPLTEIHVFCMKEQSLLCASVCVCLITSYINLSVTSDPSLQRGSGEKLRHRKPPSSPNSIISYI